MSNTAGNSTSNGTGNGRKGAAWDPVSGAAGEALAEAMLSLKNVTKTYGRAPAPAVSNLSLEVRRGELFGVLGPNGAGKTTTLKMIVGLLQPDQGSIRLNGIDVVQDPLSAKRQIGYVPDSPDVWDRMKGSEYLRFMADVYQVPGELRLKRVLPLLEDFELLDAIEEPIRTYSHGMRQKLVLIGALLPAPALLVLDEPMVGLDPRSAYRMKEMLREHCRKGNTVLFSTHILDVAERLCDRVGIIHRGKLIASGTLDEMRSLHAAGDRTLEAIFLELTEAHLPGENGGAGSPSGATAGQSPAPRGGGR